MFEEWVPSTKAAFEKLLSVNETFAKFVDELNRAIEEYLAELNHEDPYESDGRTLPLLDL